MTGVGFVNSLTQGAVTALLVVYASERLGISTSSPMIGAVWTAVSVGGVVGGALVLPRLPAQWPVGAITVGALTIAPVVLFVVATTGNTGAAITALVVYSGCATVTILNGIGARQRLTPDRLQGRVNTTARMVAWGGSPVGALIAGGNRRTLGHRHRLPRCVHLCAGRGALRVGERAADRPLPAQMSM